MKSNSNLAEDINNDLRRARMLTRKHVSLVIKSRPDITHVHLTDEQLDLLEALLKSSSDITKVMANHTYHPNFDDLLAAQSAGKVLALKKLLLLPNLAKTLDKQHISNQEFADCLNADQATQVKLNRLLSQLAIREMIRRKTMTLAQLMAVNQVQFATLMTKNIQRMLDPISFHENTSFANCDPVMSVKQALGLSKNQRKLFNNKVVNKLFNKDLRSATVLEQYEASKLPTPKIFPKPKLTVDIDDEFEPSTIDSAKIDELVAKLTKYIDRIDKNKMPGSDKHYSQGFVFFKQSRAYNRKLNYLLASELRNAINEHKGDLNDLGFALNHYFDKHNIALHRDVLAQTAGPGKKRNINSKELNKVIKEIRHYAKEHKPVFSLAEL